MSSRMKHLYPQWKFQWIQLQDWSNLWSLFHHTLLLQYALCPNHKQGLTYWNFHLLPKKWKHDLTWIWKSFHSHNIWLVTFHKSISSCKIAYLICDIHQVGLLPSEMWKCNDQKPNWWKHDRQSHEKWSLFYPADKGQEKYEKNLTDLISRINPRGFLGFQTKSLFWKLGIAI